MRKLLKVDLVLAFVIVCIAMTLTVVVAFATPGETHQVHQVHPSPPTKE
ncbi:hypothetical protein [Reyranella sp.]|jgi:hypothetical protein|nr:hypothetical protein [Reyranella sp.]HQS18725.1 hypothetical protein [Reyranella sp.]HQT15151.1 hypothetical protein [Reyranella sp.]